MEEGVGGLAIGRLKDTIRLAPPPILAPSPFLIQVHTLTYFPKKCPAGQTLPQLLLPELPPPEAFPSSPFLLGEVVDPSKGAVQGHR